MSPQKNYNDEYPETKAAIQAGNEPAGHPKPGWVKSHISMKVEDPEKMARTNWPRNYQRTLPSRGLQARRDTNRRRKGNVLVKPE